MLKTYKLIDTCTNQIVKSVKLTEAELKILNYAYALNGSFLRYSV